MGAGRADAVVGILRRVAEVDVDILRHPLDFEREDAELVHRFGDAGGDHAEVLAAGKHACRAEEGGQLFHGLLLPEGVVADVEEVVVEVVVDGFLPVVEAGIAVGVLRGDPGVIPALLPRVFDEDVGEVVEALGAEFVGRIRESRGEVAHKAALVFDRNLPYTEESEDVVDTEGVEVLAHLAEAGLPPGVAGLGHPLPVVGREAPVLAVRREGVRRGAGLGVHVEEVGIGPGVGAEAAHAYRQVALKDDALVVGIGHGLLELDVELVLDEVPETDLSPVILLVRRRLAGRIDCIASPFREIGSPLFVTEAAIDRIREQPLVGRDELLAGGALKDLLSGDLIDFAEIFDLLDVDLFVVYLGESVEGVLELPVGLVDADAGIRQVDELRVEREGRHGVVGIRIGPGEGHRRVVDGEELDDALTGQGGPVGEFFDVVELAYAEAVLGPEGEDRHCSARSPPWLRPEDGGEIAYDMGLALWRDFEEIVVVRGFPEDRGAGLFVNDDEFELEGLLHVEGYRPLRETGLVENLELLPVAEGPAAAGDRHGLAAAHVRDGHGERHVACALKGRHGFVVTEYHVAESGTVERRISRTVPPALEDADGLLRLCRETEHVAAPLRAHGLAVPQKFKRVFCPLLAMGLGKIDSPDAAGQVLHRPGLVSGPEHQALPPSGLVPQRNLNSHSVTYG